MRYTSRCLSICAAAACLSTAPRAHAQAAEGSGTEQALTPPRLVTFVEAKLDVEARPAQPTAVLAELTIDEQGHVVDVALLRGAGEPIDAAVLEALRAFVFEPARRGETALKVKVEYRYVVEPRALAEAEPEPVPPLPAAEAPAASEPPAAPDTPAEPASAAPAAAREDSELAEYTGTAEIEAPPREVTKRSVGKEQLTRIPGTRGDALKAIEVLPGVARTSGFGDPILRGAAWNESATFLDGVPVPFLFHFGGLTSFMSSRLVERVDLYPSNFGVRFGRISGGIVEVRARDPRDDRLHGVVDFNLIDSSLLIEAPAGEGTAVAAAARRSNIDFFFENFVPKDAYDVVAAPLYWDYQLMLSRQLSADHRLRVMSYGSRDSVELLFAEPADEDPALAGSVGGSIEFHRVQGSLRSQLSSSATQELTVALGYIDIQQQFGPLVQEVDGPELHGRGEWSFELSPALRLTTGADFAGWFAAGSYRGPVPGQAEGTPDGTGSLASERIVSLELDTLNVIRAGAYTELSVRPVKPLLVVPGVRADYYEDIRAWSVDPRLSARYELTEATALKAGVGLYSQGPEYWQVLRGIGNPKLDPYRALHTSAGVEQRFGEAVKLGLEGFYKRLYDRVVSTRNEEPPLLVNAGVGRAYGAELSAEIMPQEGTFTYVAYTLSRSERRDLDGRFRLFDQDQTHIATIAAGHELGAGWEVGARFRFVSGNPATPVTSSVYDARTGVYVPVYGEVNSVREPSFHQLDLRVEKRFSVGDGNVAVYLDLQNAYNAENQEGVRYSYDYREQEAVSGLPILPNLGVRGEL